MIEVKNLVDWGHHILIGLDIADKKWTLCKKDGYHHTRIVCWEKKIALTNRKLVTLLEKKNPSLQMLEMLTRNPSEREKKIIPLWFGMFFWRGQFEMAIFGFPTYFYPMTEYFNAQWFQRHGGSYLIKVRDFWVFLVNLNLGRSFEPFSVILSHFESFWVSLVFQRIFPNDRIFEILEHEIECVSVLFMLF